MPKIVAYPFERLDAEFIWNDWSIIVDHLPVKPFDVAEQWDANAFLTASIQVSTRSPLVIDRHDAELIVTASCSPTNSTFHGASRFTRSDQSATAVADLSFDGHSAAGEVFLRARVTLPILDSVGQPIPWLKRRIVAEFPPLRIPLDSSRTGFPITAISFSKSDRLASPWAFEVYAISLTDSFQSSLRLFLNEDYPAIKSLIRGSANTVTTASLRAAIASTLITTAARLWAESPEEQSIDNVAELYPDSLAASASRVASQLLRLDSLGEAVNLAQSQPQALAVVSRDVVA